MYSQLYSFELYLLELKHSYSFENLHAMKQVCSLFYLYVAVLTNQKTSNARHLTLDLTLDFLTLDLTLDFLTLDLTLNITLGIASREISR